MPLIASHPRAAEAAAARLFHAFSDETRFAVLQRLRRGEQCVCDLQGALDAAQSRLSFHLKVLKDAGLVTDRKKGRWTYYALDAERLSQAHALLQELATPTSGGGADALHQLERRRVQESFDAPLAAPRIGDAREARGACCE